MAVVAGNKLDGCKSLTVDSPLLILLRIPIMLSVEEKRIRVIYYLFLFFVKNLLEQVIYCETFEF